MDTAQIVAICVASSAVTSLIVGCIVRSLYKVKIDALAKENQILWSENATLKKELRERDVPKESEPGGIFGGLFANTSFAKNRHTIVGGKPTKKSNRSSETSFFSRNTKRSDDDSGWGLGAVISSIATTDTWSGGNTGGGGSCSDSGGTSSSSFE